MLLATYTYDAMGRRVRKVIADLGSSLGGLSGNITAGTTDYLYDGQQCVEERVSDAMTKQYVWGLYVDELLEINNGGTKYYPLQDLLYRTNVLTNSSGAIFEKFDYDAYGNTLIFDSGDTPKSNPVCEFLFTGRRLDTESELYFYRARYYNPELGRFISRDPIGYKAGGLSLYEYCRSSPVVAVDPFGLAALLTKYKDCTKSDMTDVTHSAVVITVTIDGEEKEIVWSYEKDGWNEYDYDEYLENNKDHDIYVTQIDGIDDDKVDDYALDYDGPKYDLCTNNCDMQAVKAIKTGGEYNPVGSIKVPKVLHKVTKAAYGPDKRVNKGNRK